MLQFGSIFIEPRLHSTSRAGKFWCLPLRTVWTYDVSKAYKMVFLKVTNMQIGIAGSTGECTTARNCTCQSLGSFVLQGALPQQRCEEDLGSILYPVATSTTKWSTLSSERFFCMIPKVAWLCLYKGKWQLHTIHTIHIAYNVWALCSPLLHQMLGKVLTAMLTGQVCMCAFANGGQGPWGTQTDWRWGQCQRVC